MARYFSVIGPGLAAVCGVFTIWTSLQPELKKQQEEREGTFEAAHKSPPSQDNRISQAIFSDIKDAQREITERVDTKGFAWGIRNALFGGSTSDSQSREQPTSPLDSKDKPIPEKRE